MQQTNDYGRDISQGYEPAPIEYLTLADLEQDGWELPIEEEESYEY